MKLKRQGNLNKRQSFNLLCTEEKDCMVELQNLKPRRYPPNTFQGQIFICHSCALKDRFTIELKIPCPPPLPTNLIYLNPSHPGTYLFAILVASQYAFNLSAEIQCRNIYQCCLNLVVVISDKHELTPKVQYGRCQFMGSNFIGGQYFKY